MPLLRRTGSKSATRGPYRTVIWAVLLGLLFGLIGAGEYPEDRLRVVRNYFHERPVSGDIVLVAIDEKSVQKVGRWPWPRSRYAELISKIGASHPKMQVHDFIFPDRTTPVEDAALERAISSNTNVVLAILDRVGIDNEPGVSVRSLPRFYRNAQIGSISAHYNYANEIWNLNYWVPIGGRKFPTFATIMTERKVSDRPSFRIDYAFDVKSIPKISAIDLLAGRVPASALRGKVVIVGPDAWRQYDQYMIPGQGKYGGVYVHIIAAETLKAGDPVDMGWLLVLVITLGAILLCLRMSGPKRPLVLVAVGIGLLAVPVALEANLIFIDITPALFTLIFVGTALGWAHAKKRGLVNTVSGLPNMHALRRSHQERNRTLVAARILNFPQIVSTMSLAQEANLIEQIVARLKVGSEIETVYQGDEGIFAWTVQPDTAIGHHVEALHALFRSPAKVDGKQFDISVSFGVEIGSGRSISNRLGSALVAADEAHREGLRWKYHDPERLKDAEWRLSLLGQLDNAIDNGQVWVAFQPQMDLTTGFTKGAEALARWTHPEKGPISPSEFIAAAEQNDRIEKLTFFVLDRAIAVAAKVNRDHRPFDMAVNLSARMLSNPILPSRVSALLRKHHLDPARLTLELTETATLATNGSDIEPLLRLRDLGIKISIDDYGTGLSTLEYLKKIPASEIKIDQSFVKSMRDNRSDLVMVQSTIALAHSLGRTVVAEGVENRETLDLLVAMKCEVAQGFVIARPSSFSDLSRRLTSERKRRAA
ncbi:MAG: EAL domain-containing protein [Sphingomonas sp.]|uniref:EAL domain-containing protein n=1 Tax=Sphingomonas sp. TaxID=28214 RepID=UPI0017E605D0|nr:EAL domain-containing protein [Sphingomonas sp.]MBA3666238.1 EAL domain-containing protein [Sphingomonas sp.]